MDESKEICAINIRFNLSIPDHQKAWEHLQFMDRAKYKSYTKVIVAAINEYFARQENFSCDPYLETREKEDAFLARVTSAVKEGASEAMPMLMAASLLKILQPALNSIGVIGMENGLAAGNPSASAAEDTTNADADAALSFADGF